MWKTLSKLESQGTVVQAWGNLQKFISKVILLAGTCDLPAKCLILNFRQFNGFMGCSKCLQPGKTLKLGPRAHTHIYPYVAESPSGPLRSRQQTAKDVEHYLETGSTRNGVLGPSWFGCLRYFDSIRGTAIDYMHGCLLGVMRRLLRLWLEPANHKQKFYIGQLSSLLDRRLLSIKPPAEISRAPRSISDRKHWKASEYRSFLLYYSLPVLQGILPDENFQHFALLVVSMRKLVADSIPPKDILESEKLLNLFCKRFAQLYGDKEMTVNIHGLLHLATTVRELGPLWAYSCFFFEGLNGLLLRHVHGTQGIGLQCVRTFSMIQAFPSPDKLPAVPNEPEFLMKVVKRFQSGSTKPKILGKVEVSCQLQSEELSAIQRAVAEGLPLDTDRQCTCRFTRIRMNGITFHSLSWQESQRRHNCTVKFSGHSSQSHYFGQIEHFAKLRDDSGALRLCAFITLLQCSTPFSSLPLPTEGFYAVERTTTLVVIEAIGLINKCIHIHLGDRNYISEFVDIFEKD